MIDFTIYIYKKLLHSLKSKYKISKTFYEYILDNSAVSDPIQNNSFFILRHDVDRLPLNSLRLAEIENSYGIKGTYYFRIIPKVYKLEILESIAKLGHEIGYHYEDVDLVLKKLRRKSKNLSETQIIDLAYDSFCKNLELFRRNFDVKTICMHGSPLSKYDNKIIWKKYNYKDLGILGEPYLDINWNEWGYLTDTGRRWNGSKFNIRDKVNSNFHSSYKRTSEIIQNINNLPKKIMITIHPERWNDNLFYWFKEIVGQNIKNIFKRFVSFKS